ncbi:unnamed protein product [Effrenium voratum]|nr:unnamed protein product [Effrenium voratum]
MCGDWPPLATAENNSTQPVVARHLQARATDAVSRSPAQAVRAVRAMAHGLLLLLLHAVAGQEYQVTERRVLYEGAPVIPGTYDNVTAWQCQAFCNANANCSSFSFCGSSCYLKQACLAGGEALVNASTYTGNCVTHYKQCSSLEGYLVKERLLLQQGLEIENVMTDDLGVCAEACNQNSQCKSFSFYANSKGCHLKSKCVEPDDEMVPEGDPAAVYRTFYRCCSCTTTTSTTTFSPWRVLDRALLYEGVPVEPGVFSDRTYTVSECRSICDGNQSCHSFSFCGSACYMKQLCATEELELVPVESWNGCATHYKPCGLTTSAPTIDANSSDSSSDVNASDANTTAGNATDDDNKTDAEAEGITTSQSSSTHTEKPAQIDVAGSTLLAPGFLVAGLGFRLLW